MGQKRWLTARCMLRDSPTSRLLSPAAQAFCHGKLGKPWLAHACVQPGRESASAALRRANSARHVLQRTAWGLYRVLCSGKQAGERHTAVSRAMVVTGGRGPGVDPLFVELVTAVWKTEECEYWRLVNRLQ